MSDTNLAPHPVPCTLAGKEYLLGHTDQDLELLYQTAHEAWARGRLEARKQLLPAEVHLADVQEFNALVNANRFAFGGPLSVGFLGSDQGAFEYVLLKLQKGAASPGGRNVSRQALQGIRRAHKEEYNALAGEVLVREFPFWFTRTAQPPPSPEAGTPTPGTNGSASSSPESPSACPGEKSSPLTVGGF